jgi:DNA-binding response OmpR family regulator
MVSFVRERIMATTRILIVDDDALMRRSLAFNLEQAGYRVSTAANAEDALALSERVRMVLRVGLSTLTLGTVESM